MKSGQDDSSHTKLSDIGEPADHRRWVKLGLWLVAGTMAYNAVEAVIALWAGARAHSIALVGFGFDSFIELAAAAVVLWRISVEAGGGSASVIKRAEDRVRRFVGVTFFALAAYVLLQAGWDLWARSAPEESLIGLVLAGVSLLVMPLVAFWKLRVARVIDSRALRAEAKETIACSYLSFCLLIGLAANAIVGWWWADPVAALAMVPWLVREGFEGFEEDGCGCG